MGRLLRARHPTRFGLPAAQLKQLLDRTGGLWQQGNFVGKPVTSFTSFTSSMNTHGGQESTILALNNVFYHWDSLIVAPGYSDPLLFAAGGNPYGTSPTSNDGPPSDATLEAAHYQGQLVVDVTRRLGNG